jgi:hypothetical protein
MLKTLWKKTGLLVGNLIIVTMALGPIFFILLVGN